MDIDTNIKLGDLDNRNVYTDKLITSEAIEYLIKDINNNPSGLYWSDDVDDTVVVDLSVFDGLGVYDTITTNPVQTMETISQIVRESEGVEGKIYVELAGSDDLPYVALSDIDDRSEGQIITTDVQVSHVDNNTKKTTLKTIYKCQKGHHTPVYIDRGDEIKKPMMCAGTDEEDCNSSPYRRLSEDDIVGDSSCKIINMTTQKMIFTDSDVSDINSRRMAGEVDVPLIDRVQVRDKIRVIARVRSKENEDEADTSYYIHVLGFEPLNDDELTDEDVEEMEELSEEIEPLEDLISVIGEEYGIQDNGSGQVNRARKSLLISAVKGSSDTANHNLHLLIMGLAGSGKTKMARSLLSLLNDNGQFVNLEKSSEAGIIGANVQSEELGGRYVVESGAVTQADGSVCVIDEVDKTDRSSEQNILGEPMEDAQIKITKTAKAELPADVSFVLTANPEGKDHYTSDTPISEVSITGHIKDRLDLATRVDPYRADGYGDDLDERKNNVKESLMTQIGDSETDGLSRDTVGKYLKHAQEHEPEICDDVIDDISESVVRVEQELDDGSERVVDSIVNISTAIAKLNFREEVETEDVEQATELYIDCWDSVLDN